MQNQALGPMERPSTDLLNRSLDQFQSRARLSEGASAQQSKADLKKVAQDFESLFVGYLLKVMRETIEEAGTSEGGMGKSIYTELFDEELAKTISKQGKFGIADILMRRLSSQEPADGAPADKSSAETQPGTPGVPAAPIASQPGPESDEGVEISDVHLPVRGPVSSGFGMRKDPFTRQPRFHKGMDLAAPEGTEVRAALEGEVVYAGFKPGYGNTIIVQHAGGLETTYAHLGSIDVKKGATISGDQILGLVGNSGHSTGPHLHFEVSRWGEPINPRDALTD